jgi:carboxypeptidase Taq
MNNYNDYVRHSKKITDVNMSMGVLSWDQETKMPKNGSKFRAQQLSTLAGISHDLSINKEFGCLLNKLSTDNTLNNEQARNIELSLKKYNISKKYSSEFVIEQSKLISIAFQKWRLAKEKDDFKIFEESLSDLVELRKKECEILGYNDHPYDALLNQYEPGLTTSEVEVIFTNVRKNLVPFIKEISYAKQIDDSFYYQHFNKDKQWDFGIRLLDQMGYDFNCGRQDISAHPFSTSFSPDDARVTTRIDENNLSEMIWSCIHEGGHALYEQGILSKNYGLPSGETISLGIHESQSRLWENNVGRSLAYWKKNFNSLKSIFPDKLSNISAVDFYKAANNVKPSLIRTNADELTYHLHVLIRFEIEKSLIEGSISVKDLPSIWNAKYKEYLNIDVPSDSKGVLQDIHWSHGSFGYFPTYTIGSFYAAQFYSQALNEIPNLENEIEEGNMKNLLNWLRIKIHKHGKKYDAQDLCIKITGKKLEFKYFMDYAKEKYSKIYSIK